MENIPCKNGAPPAHARGRRNLWSIYPLHTPHKGPGAAFPQGSGLSGHSRTCTVTAALPAPVSPARTTPPAVPIRPVRPPRAMMAAAGMAPGRTSFLPRCGPSPAKGSPARSLPPCHEKDRHPGDDGRFSCSIFPVPSGTAAFLPACFFPPIRVPAQTATYFFRASESTMAWAWASSTFPASRTSTCRSVPRASTPRMGTFPAWPCIS